jgi:enterochelin esterase-like enzyme
MSQGVVRVLEPQGTVFLVLLVLGFAGLVTWVALSSHVVVRAIAAFLAFIPAAVFGIAVVNKYYDYYQTWGALYSDLSGSGTQSVPQLAVAQPGGTAVPGSLGGSITASAGTGSPAQTGYLFRSTVTGRSTRISRDVYVYLPPQYFQPRYRRYRFPAIELLHGSPGEPQSWIDVLGLIPTYLRLLHDGQATPAVLVIPDTDGGGHYALQCLNYPHGLQDMTYVGAEVPDWASASLRIVSPGPAWGVAGYSEGGYCAANIGLQLASRFGYVGSLSGYFAPSSSAYPAGGQPGAPAIPMASPLAAYPRLEALNSPQERILQAPVSVQAPRFFLAAGQRDLADVTAARAFQQTAMTRVSSIPLVLVQGGGHQAAVWRVAIGPLLHWMTPQLTDSAKQAEAIARRAKARHAVTARQHKPSVMAAGSRLPGRSAGLVTGPRAARG